MKKCFKENKINQINFIYHWDTGKISKLLPMIKNVAKIYWNLLTYTYYGKYESGAYIKRLKCESITTFLCVFERESSRLYY